MTKHLYRKVAVCAIVACAASLSFGQAKLKPRTGPRAISVLEMDGKGHAQLVPVTILFYDKYYDAALYQQNPVPMALEPGNIYDVLQANLVIGLFTTEQPKEVRGNWVSLGTWKEKSAEPEHKASKVDVSVPDDGRPVLKRHGAGGAAGSHPSPSDDDPDRPTLKKPQAPAEPESAPSSSSSTSTVAKTTAAPVDQDLTRDTNETDPDRPVLRKSQGNPTDVAVKMTPPIGPARVAAPATIAPQSGAEQIKSYIAISDAQKTDYRPFQYDLQPDEKAKLTAKAQKIAAFQLQKWALAHGGVKLVPSLTFTDYDARVFDVDYSNNPEMVFTASFSPVATAKSKPITYYLTMVARGDANGDLNPIFSQITDSTRLDAYARLELIDAVDPDGFGRGSLLFREYKDSGKAFVLYRVDPYNLTKLFEGASGE
jgi:hypothetical protein